MNKEFTKVATTAERLSEAMAARKMKQIDLVRISGIDKGSISHYVSGNYEPKNESVLKLAKALDVSDMWLWGYDVPMERQKAEKKADLHAKVLKDEKLLHTVEEYYSLSEEMQDFVRNMIHDLAQKKEA